MANADHDRREKGSVIVGGDSGKSDSVANYMETKSNLSEGRESADEGEDSDGLVVLDPKRRRTGNKADGPYDNPNPTDQIMVDIQNTSNKNQKNEILAGSGAETRLVL